MLLLQFKPGENRETHNLMGHELYSIEGIAEVLSAGKEVTLRASSEDGEETVFTTVARLDSRVEVEYYRNGGILQTVLRQMVRG